MIAVALLAPVGMLMLLLALDRLEQSTVEKTQVELDLRGIAPQSETFHRPWRRVSLGKDKTSIRG